MNHYYWALFILIKVALLAGVLYYMYRAQQNAEELDLISTRDNIIKATYIAYVLLGIYALALVAHPFIENGEYNKMSEGLHGISHVNIAVLLVFIASLCKAKSSIENDYQIQYGAVSSNIFFLKSLIMYWLGFNVVAIGSLAVANRQELGKIFTRRSSNRRSNK